MVTRWHPRDGAGGVVVGAGGVPAPGGRPALQHFALSESDLQKRAVRFGGEKAFFLLLFFGYFYPLLEGGRVRPRKETHGDDGVHGVPVPSQH